MTQPEQFSINASTYLAQKVKGVVRIIKVNGVAQYAMRRFHPEEGHPIPLLVPIDVATVQAREKAVRDELAGLEALEADILAAKEV